MKGVITEYSGLLKIQNRQTSNLNYKQIIFNEFEQMWGYHYSDLALLAIAYSKLFLSSVIFHEVQFLVYTSFCEFLYHL